MGSLFLTNSCTLMILKSLWAATSSGFTHSVIFGSMLPIHKRFPSWATLSEMMEAFSTVPAADDMCTLWEAGTKEIEIRFTKKMQR